MKIDDYNRLISYCIKQYNVTNPNDVYVAVEWFEGEYHPIYRKLVETDVASITCYADLKLVNSEFCGPQPFYIHGGYRETDLVKTTLTLEDIRAMDGIYNCPENVIFMLQHGDLPHKLIGDINPHRTYMVKNADNVDFLIFHRDFRMDDDIDKLNSEEYTFDKRISFYKDNIHFECS